MTLARIKATGRGKLDARVAIDGWPYEFVTSSSMATTAADGRVRIVGLRMDTLRKGARADLARGSLTAQGFRVVVENVTRAKLATLALGKRPQLTTWCTPAGASIDDTTATIPVADTTAWPASGYGHIATEAFSYTGKTATTFTGCTRGIWGTVAQYHYAPDGAGLSYPRVTEVPQSLEGRRVRVYLYGDGDSKTGDGTLEVIGVASTDRSYEAGEWSFSVDPITRLLDQEVGGDLEAPVPIRGIYYPWNAPFVLSLSAPILGVTVTIRVTGFYETQQDFCDAVTAAIASATSGWAWAAGSSIVAQVLDASLSWMLVYRVGTGPAGTVADVTIAATVAVWLSGDDTAGTYTDLDVFDTAGWRGDDDDPVLPAALVAGRVYRQYVTAFVPRATVGGPSPRERSGRSGLEPDETNAPIRRIYLGGLIVPTTGMDFMIGEEGSDEGDPVLARALVDVSARWVSVGCPFHVMGPRTRLTVGRGVATGTVEDFRAALVANAAELANAGGSPLVTSADWSSTTDVAEAAAEHRTGSGRRFVFYQALKLRELVEHELRAIGCFMRLSSSGAMEVKRLRPSLPTDSITWTFDESTICGVPKVERAAFGHLSAFRYRTGYDPKEDEWSKNDVTARDVASSSPTRVGGELLIAQRSVAPSRYESDTRLAEADVDEVARLAMGVLGLFGGAYDIATLPVSLKALSVQIGDGCQITHSLYPNDDGTEGVEDLPGMVVGYDFTPAEGGGTVDVLVHGQRYGGYAPSLRVTGQANVAGNTWDLTVQLTGYTDAAAASSVFTVADLVRVTEQDTATPTQLDGAIDSFQSATVIRVTFTGVWVPGAVEWCVRVRPSTSYADVETGLGRYVYNAESTRRVDYATTDADAREWAP